MRVHRTMCMSFDQIRIDNRLFRSSNEQSMSWVKWNCTNRWWNFRIKFLLIEENSWMKFQEHLKTYPLFWPMWKSLRAGFVRCVWCHCHCSASPISSHKSHPTKLDAEKQNELNVNLPNSCFAFFVLFMLDFLVIIHFKEIEKKRLVRAVDIISFLLVSSFKSQAFTHTARHADRMNTQKIRLE